VSISKGQPLGFIIWCLKNVKYFSVGCDVPIDSEVFVVTVVHKTRQILFYRLDLSKVLVHVHISEKKK
jgi:hypothetical protein